MRRRQVLASLSAVPALAAAGCVETPSETGGSDGDTNGDRDGDTDGDRDSDGDGDRNRDGNTDALHAPAPSDPPELPGGPKEPPEKPAEITPESISEYVAAFERAYVYNRLHCSDPGSISVSADGATTWETDHGVYAFASASGYSECETDRGTVVADHGPEPHAYAVGEEFVVRIDGGRSVSRGRDEAYGSEGFDDDAAGLAVTNFDDRTHDLSVRVTQDGDVAYADDLTVGSRSTLRLTSVSAVAADHELTVETAAGAAGTGTWRVDTGELYAPMVRVLATGAVEIERRDPWSVTA